MPEENQEQVVMAKQVKQKVKLRLLPKKQHPKRRQRKKPLPIRIFNIILYTYFIYNVLLL